MLVRPSCQKEVEVYKVHGLSVLGLSVARSAVLHRDAVLRQGQLSSAKHLSSALLLRVVYKA